MRAVDGSCGNGMRFCPCSATTRAPGTGGQFTAGVEWRNPISAYGMTRVGARTCGWWMRQHLGGHYGPEFNTARNWLNAGQALLA
jgi:hypothetical protein